MVDFEIFLGNKIKLYVLMVCAEYSIFKITLAALYTNHKKQCGCPGRTHKAYFPTNF
jgi:hypothetical protein